MHLIQLSEVASTNSHLRLLLQSQDLPSYTIVDTRAQTQGRGQRGNSWESQEGQNITCSILLREPLTSEVSSQEETPTPFDLNIITSLALYDTLCQYLSPQDIQIKWPNDIIIHHHKKIAGILIENQWLGTQLQYSIIGIGLNVHQTNFQTYQPTATSLALEGAHLHTEYTEWHHTLLHQLTEALSIRHQQLHDALPKLRQTYHDHLLGLGKEHTYTLASGQEILGTLTHIHPQGTLELNTPQGTQLFQFKEIKINL